MKFILSLYDFQEDSFFEFSFFLKKIFPNKVDFSQICEILKLT